MRLVTLFFLSGVLLLLSMSGEPGMAQFGGKGGKGKGDVAGLDAAKVFDLLAKGKNTLDSTDLRGTIRTSLEEYAKANKLDPAMITRAQFQAFMDAKAGIAKNQDVSTPGSLPKFTNDPIAAAEEVLRAAGLNTDDAALLEYFRERTRPNVDLQDMLVLARQLGDADLDKRTSATAKLLARGPWAIPALNHVMNGHDNPLAIQHSRHCLDWLEGKRSAEIPVAVARLLAARKPDAATGVLLAFLPLADDQSVVDGVKAALSSIAARPGKLDAALLAALHDPLPQRRAIAVEVLADSGKPAALLEARKLLTDRSPQVRLRTALALTQQLDESAIDALIDLLAVSPANERRQAEAALRQLAGAWSPSPPSAGDDELSRKIRREVWSAWWRALDGPTLLTAFRQRTLTKEEAVVAQALIEQLGDKAFGKRELASAALIAQSNKVAGLLREAKSSDSEYMRRVAACLKEIALNETRDKLPLSAPCLLAARKPAGTVDALLGFVPFTDDRAMTAEIVKSLIRLQRSQGTLDSAIIRALSDPLAARRVVAAETLVGAGGASHPAVRKLLTDADPKVRLPVAVALVHARDKDAVPALIDLVANLPPKQAWEADDLLRRVAGANAPARPFGDDAAARKTLQAAWQAWWKDHATTVDLAALNKAIVVSSLTVVAELAFKGGINNPLAKKAKAGGGFDPFPAKRGEKGKKGNPLPLPGNPIPGTDRLVALDGKRQPQWQIDNLEHPIDFQMLADDRVLIAEYAGNRVTERDLTGKILWEVHVPRPPVNVQRLANGNTFIALYHTPLKGGGTLLEVDRAGKTVASLENPAGALEVPAGRSSIVRAAYKLADGTMICLANNQMCVRLDAACKELKRFALPLYGGVSAVVTQVPNFAGNLDVTSKGHVVVALSDNTVGEYDRDGKLVWQAKAAASRATRLANGNTLVTLQAGGIIELDSTGKSVWHYEPPAGYHAIRARRGGEMSQTANK